VEVIVSQELDADEADGNRCSSQVAGMLMIALVGVVLDLIEALVLTGETAGAPTRTAP
jgi:hypothetical protein